MTPKRYMEALVAEAKQALAMIGTAESAIAIARAHERYRTILRIMALPGRLLKPLDPEGAKAYGERVDKIIDEMELAEFFGEERKEVTE